MGVSVRSRAPVRISFAGGGTDVSPYPEERGGCVISTAINKYSFTSLKTHDSKFIKMSTHGSTELLLESMEETVMDGNFDLAKTVLMEIKPKDGLEIFFRNDVPPRSGLGSSAAGFVSLIGAFNSAYKMGFSRHKIAQLAFDLERNRLKIKGGKQDQFASAYGGFNFIEFKENKVKVNPLRLKPAVLNELEKNLILVFTRKREKQGHDIIADQTKSLLTKKKDVLNAFDSAKAIAIEMKNVLSKADMEGFGKLLHEGWVEKKKYSKHISNPFIDKLYEKALHAGAIGGKISGAGGGGHMVFYCYPDKEINVKEALASMGATHIPFSFDFKGLQTWSVKEDE